MQSTEVPLQDGDFLSERCNLGIALRDHIKKPVDLSLPLAACACSLEVRRNRLIAEQGSHSRAARSGNCADPGMHLVNLSVHVLVLRNNGMKTPSALHVNIIPIRFPEVVGLTFLNCRGMPPDMDTIAKTETKPEWKLWWTRLAWTNWPRW